MSIDSFDRSHADVAMECECLRLEIINYQRELDKKQIEMCRVTREKDDLKALTMKLTEENATLMKGDNSAVREAAISRAGGGLLNRMMSNLMLVKDNVTLVERLGRSHAESGRQERG